ncbi:MAG: hypothetical protein Q8M31_04035 [Beijerinckiaceae bacterium]|nr:hypothetical protein [Beijerinckiaceae bacterium]
MTTLTALFARLQTSDEVLAAVVSLILTGAGFLILRLLAGRPIILWGDTSESHFLLPQNQASSPLSVHTRTIWFQNTGRAPADEVEVSLNYAPQHVEVFPHVPFERLHREDGRIILRFTRMNPKEYLMFNLFSALGPIPQITNVRFIGGNGKKVTYQPQRIFSRRVQVAVGVLILLGFATAVYLLIRLILLAM